VADNAKTTVQHWDAVYGRPPHLRLPLAFVVSTRNLQRLLERYVRPGMTVVEVGCAPGKHLAWVTHTLGAHVSGLDYSARGLEFSRRLFEALGLTGDLRCEDLLNTTLANDAFDLVYSVGVIEHFDDPRPIVARHVALARPGGVVVIAVPNYRGVYGTLQRHFDAPNLAIHNLQIMTEDGLRGLAPSGTRVRAYPFGRLDPWLVNFGRRWPSVLATAVSWALNGVGLIQPVALKPLAPWLVLEIAKPATPR
jgi:2-polyprenyl-3-methyl-5-hydroxy-6-metoxy-1,4-benzoquinol methylase